MEVITALFSAALTVLLYHSFIRYKVAKRIEKEAEDILNKLEQELKKIEEI